MRTRPSTAASFASMLSVALGSVLLAGCGSSSSGSDDSDATAGLTGEPIRIGYVNTEGKGAVSLPGYTVGAERAVRSFNEDGGVDGRPVVLEKCLTDGSPASSLGCANGFVEDGVALVLVGADLGFDGAVPVLTGAGIPAFSMAFNGPEASAESTFFQVGSPAGARISVPITVFTDLDVAGFDLVGPDVPAVKQIHEKVATPMAKAAALKNGLVTFDPAAVDFSSVVSTLKANKTEAVFFNGTDEQCSAFASSATSLGYEGVTMMGVCTAFIEELGGDVAGYLALNILYPPEARDDAPDHIQAELDQYGKDIEDVEGTDAFSLYGYASVIDVGRVLQTIEGEISAATVTSAFAGLTDFRGFAGNTLNCADRPAAQGAACDDSLLVLKVTDDGKVEVVGDGFTTPPDA